MKFLKRIITLVIVATIWVQVIAQERTIVGKVTAFNTIPLNNIKVLSKKTGKETVTDQNGNFNIKCANDDRLKFVSEGFQARIMKIKNEKDNIKVNLLFVNNLKNRELVVSNRYIDRDTLDYAIANLPNRTKDFSKYATIYDLIQAECPGVQIRNKEIIIPPVSTISGSQAALIILDGMDVIDISHILPSTVTSVELLKGSGTSFYGIRGGNGVLIIKTFGKK